MVIGSLFSGAGLLDAGLHQAGHEHAWFVERDEFRRGLLGRRWPGRPVHDDVRTVGAHNLERVECIAGGFPCRGTSTAGLRNGLDHPETALWAEFARIVRELGPRYVVVENVGNVLAVHDGGVWRVVLRDLAETGYDVAWGCFRASDFGAPHQRERVVAIARHAKGASGQGAWAEREALGRVGAAGDEPSAHASRHGEGGPGETAGADGQRTRPRADAAPDASLVGHEQSSGASTSPPSADGKPSTGLRLNPSFVGWMMGTPSCGECGREWTDPDCPHSATAYTSTSAGSSASTSSASSESGLGT
jgi:site-specific DNA-cytosine methylase